MGDLRRAALLVFVASAPDIDLLLRFVDGRNHHQIQTHSLGFALLAGLAAAALAPVLGLHRVRTAVAVALSWSSHVLLDALARDTSVPIGLMAFWPLSAEHVHFPFSLFLDIRRKLEWSIVLHNAVAASWELAVLLPLAVITWRRAPREV